MLTEDMAVFFSTDEHAVIAIWRPLAGSVEMASVIFDKPDEDLLAGVAQTRAYQITYPATSLSTLKSGDSIEIAAIAYTVLGTPDSIDDGALMRASLSRT